MIAYFVVAAYVSLAIELVAIPVPSVASAVQLARQARRDGGDARSTIATLRYYLPVAVNVAVFLLPLSAAVVALTSGNSLPGSIGGAAITGLGILCVITGRAITVASALALRAATSPGLARGELLAPLRQSGVFAWSRNPGLVGMYLFALGLLLLVPSYLFGVGLLHYLWHMHRRVLIEETHLRARLGDAYNAYALRTRRYV